MTTAKLRLRDETTFEAEGYRLPPIAGFGFFVPFVHRKLLSFLDSPQQSDDGEWCVSDLHTGYGMSPVYLTRRKAIEGIAVNLAGKRHEIVKRDFDTALEKHGDLLVDEKKETIKTKNLNKEKDMRLTKMDDKFDGSVEIAKPKKVASKKTAPKKTVTSPKLTKDLKTLGKKAARQIAKRTLAVKSTPKDKKRCSRCKEILPLTNFHNLTKSLDGKLGHCKVCECALQKRRREVRPNIPEKPAQDAPKVTKKAVKKTVKRTVKKIAKKTAKKAVTVKKIAKKVTAAKKTAQ